MQKPCEYCHGKGLIAYTVENYSAGYAWKRCPHCDNNIMKTYLAAGINKKYLSMKLSDYKNENYYKYIYNMLRYLFKNKKCENHFLFIGDLKNKLFNALPDIVAKVILKNNMKVKVVYLSDILDFYFKESDKYNTILHTENLCVVMGFEQINNVSFDGGDKNGLVNIILRFMLTRIRAMNNTFYFYMGCGANLKQSFYNRYGLRINEMFFDNDNFKTKIIEQKNG